MGAFGGARTRRVRDSGSMRSPDNGSLTEKVEKRGRSHSGFPGGGSQSGSDAQREPERPVQLVDVGAPEPSDRNRVECRLQDRLEVVAVGYGLGSQPLSPPQRDLRPDPAHGPRHRG